jgi:hypothetical protein
MQTTLMADSSVGDDWIRNVYAACPPQMAKDAQGNQNGNILTGPVRLAFTEGVFKKIPGMKGEEPRPDGSNMKHRVRILFTAIHDMSLFWQIYCDIANREFPGSYNPNAAPWPFPSLVPPWRDQGETAQYSGHQAGSKFINANSSYKPHVLDTAYNPIVNEDMIYAGCWAIVALQPFAGGKGTPKKGPMWGLQSIVKIADDEKLGGGMPDPKSLYGGVNLGGIVPPLGGEQNAFANMPPQGSPPAMPGVPAQQLMQGGYGQHNAPASPQQGFNLNDFS